MSDAPTATIARAVDVGASPGRPDRDLSEQPEIAAQWHRAVAAQWQDPNGQTHSFSDLALNIYYSPARNTAFLKLQTRVDLRHCKHYHHYLHLPPERIRRLEVDDETPADPARRLHIELKEVPVLVTPCWPCEPKEGGNWARTWQKFQALGRVTAFSLVFHTRPKSLFNPILRALSDALARSDVVSDPEQAATHRYYRGRGAAITDLVDPAHADEADEAEGGGRGPVGENAISGPSEPPPSYQAVADSSSSPDPLRGSPPPPPKKRRREGTPAPERDDRAQLGLEDTAVAKFVLERVEQMVGGLREEGRRVQAENRELKEAVDGLRDENHRLLKAVGLVTNLATLVESLTDRVADLEQRFGLDAGDGLDARVERLEGDVVDLEEWREAHECDQDEIKDTVTQVLDDELDGFGDRVIERIAHQLLGGS